MSGEIELEESGFGNPSDHQIHQNAVVVAPGACAMKFEDVETGSMAFCRICLECDGEKDAGLISPCLCKGTQQFVHRACLDHWRSIKEGFAFSHCTTCRAQFHLTVVKPNCISWPKIKFRLFVTRDLFLFFLALQMVVGVMGGLAYAFDKKGSYRTSFANKWDSILAAYPLPFYYCSGVVFMFVVVGFLGMLYHCFAYNNDPRVAGCQNLFFGCGILDCFPTSVEIWAVIIVFLLVVFTILGLVYGFLAATLALQRIWQKHYHTLAKKELTKEFVVEDLHGCYTPPELAPEHVNRLIMMKFM